MEEQSVNYTTPEQPATSAAPEGFKIFSPAGFFIALGVMWAIAFLLHLIPSLPEWKTDWVFMIATLILSVITLIHG